MQMLPTTSGEVAGQDPQQLVQIGTQRAVGRLLDAEVLEHRDAVRACDAPRGGADEFFVDAASLCVIADADVAQCLPHRLHSVDVLGEKRLIAKVFLYQHGCHRRQAPGVGPGPHPKMDVGHLCSVGQHRVDHDHCAGRILGDLVEDDAGARKALRHPRVLPDEHRHFGVLELAAGVAAVEVGVDPRLAGLLLGERVRAVVRTKHLEERAAVRAAKMVALPAAAVVEDLVTAVGVGDALEARRDLRNCGVPVDFLIATIWASAHGRGQPVAVVLVVIQPQRLVAGVALRGGMVLVATDLGEVTAVELHDDAAVALAEDACGLLPVTVHRGFLSDSSACSSARSWPWTLSRGLRSRDARATTIAPSTAVVVSIASSSARAAETPSATSRWAIRSVQRAKAAAARSITGPA